MPGKRHRSLVRAVQGALTPDLLNAKYRSKVSHPLGGHCYVASEALWYALGGPKSDWRPQVASVGDITHWWLHGPDGILDVTADQFADGFDYTLGRGCGFLTKGISARSATVLARSLARMTARDTNISGRRVRVYRNLRSGTWSAQDAQTGRVIAHAPQIALRDASFVARASGQAKVRETGRKNVHAFVVGTVASRQDAELAGVSVRQATYNPYRYDTFVTHKLGDNRIVQEAQPADYVWLDEYNRVLAVTT